MSRRDNMKRIYVGNLPTDVRNRDIEDLFYKFGKIAFIDLKNRRGPPFAFVEFHDYRDAEEAVRARDGKKFDGCRLRVEFPRGRERPSRFKNGSGTHSRSAAPQRRSKFRVKVSNLPSSGSWQDLKDHMREFGEVCFADVYKGGEGVVEFVNYDDMRYAIRKLHNTKFKSHEGETSYIKLREDIPSGDSRSRSRSPVERTRKRSRSPAYDKDRSSPPSRSRRRGGSSNNRRPSPRSRSRSRSPRGGGDASDRARSRSRSASDRSDRASLQSRDRSNNSRSRSRSPRSVDKDNGRSPSPASKNDKPRRQRSATPDSVASDKDKSRLGARTSVSPRRDDDKHKSGSRSPRQRSASPGRRSAGSRSPSSRSGSYSGSRSSRSVSRTPTPVED